MSSTGSVDNLVVSSRSFLESLNAHRGARILTAFSGGPDSTALLHFLAETFAADSGRVGVAYYNHRLRGDEEAVSELSHAGDTAEKLRLPFYSGDACSGEIETRARKYKVSVEEAARILRYRFLHDIAEKYGFDFIATGHTRDDLVETLIQRFFQGSGVWGLCGIPKVNGKLIRPILEWSREDVESFNAARSLDPIIDPSNVNTAYLRNYIRHDVIPAVQIAFPDFKKSLATLVSKMKITREFMEDSIAAHATWDMRGDSYSMPLSRFISLHAIERIESVRSLLDQAQQAVHGTLRIPFGAFSALINPPELRDNAILFRASGYRLRIHGEEAFFEPDIVFGKRKGYFKIVSGYEETGWYTYLPGAGVCIRKTAEERTSSLPAVSIAFPLIVRSRREGDVLKVGAISKDLKKLYNEWHVPEHERWKIPVCEDRTGVIAVLGEPFGFRNLKRFVNAPRGESMSFAFDICRGA